MVAILVGNSLADGEERKSGDLMVFLVCFVVGRGREGGR